MSPKSNNPAPFGNLELPAQFWYSAIGGMDTNGSPTICGMSAAVAASDTLTFAANATDGDTFTIGSITYRAKSTMAQAYDVKIGVSAAVTLDNIKAAVNASGTFGTEYYAGTLPHPEVTATTNTNTTQLFVAKNAGAYGNRIVATETFTDAGNVFSSATFAGGTNSALKIDATSTSATQVSAAKTAGQSVVIPAGAKEWTATIWTGTATVNGAAGCPAGFSDSSDKANAATVTITFDTPGTGYVRYAT